MHQRWIPGRAPLVYGEVRNEKRTDPVPPAQCRSPGPGDLLYGDGFPLAQGENVAQAVQVGAAQMARGQRRKFGCSFDAVLAAPLVALARPGDQHALVHCRHMAPAG